MFIVESEGTKSDRYPRAHQRLPDIVDDKVERTIVTVGFLTIHELVMLGNEVSRDRVEDTQAHKETTDKIEEGLPSKVLHNDDIKQQLDQPVDEFV